MTTPQSYTRWISIGCMLAAIGVIFGAFGAHSLEQNIGRFCEDETLHADRLATWETGCRYQMYHAFGIILFGFWQVRQGAKRASNWVGYLLLLGTLIFSGCLYLLVLTNQTVLGAIVPIGGILQIIGWTSFAAISWRAVVGPPTNHESGT